MKPMDLLETMGSIRDKHIVNAHSEPNVARRTVSFRRVLLIAAVIAMLLLLVGCVAVMLGLDDLVIGTFFYNGTNGESKSGDFISLQGYIDGLCINDFLTFFYSFRGAVFQYFQLIFTLSNQCTECNGNGKSNHACSRDTYSHGIF